MRHLLISVLLVFLAQTTVTDADGFRGPAFTDPSRTWTNMPPDWTSQPIRVKPEASQADLAVTLDQQIYAQLLPLIQDYAAKHQTQIAVSNGTCGISAGLLRRKAVDIGGFCCPPGLTDRLPGLRFHTLGIAAIALITHPSNSLDNLSFAQAQRIFQGEILNWADLDGVESEGKTSPIHVIGRLHCKLRPGHWRLLLDNEDLFATDLIEVGAIQDMLGAVTNDPYAIGYETLWMIEHGGETQHTKILSLNGIRPDDRLALARGRYPLYRVYNVTSWEGSAEKPLARKLVLYLQEQMVNLDKKYNMVPASELKHHGWRFNAEELVGEPD
jgi:ABC-type phosphate transport system substrate-binding protein